MSEVKAANCPVCGKKIKGRSDKKYCGKVCSNRFHGAKKKEDVGVVAFITRSLKTNRGILKRLLGSRPQVAVETTVLQESGFDFGCCTSSETLSDGSLSKGCYDYAYSMPESSGKLIIRHSPQKK